MKNSDFICTAIIKAEPPVYQFSRKYPFPKGQSLGGWYIEWFESGSGPYELGDRYKEYRNY